MMETYVYGRPIKETQDILLVNAIYSEVIEGLNEYFESEGANDYITICSQIDSRTYVLYDPENWADILIEWLRKKHGIFYRPGMKLDQIEAARSAAKMCGLRAHIKDEISKRGLWCGADADIPELVDMLFKSYDECRECLDKNREDAMKLSEENQKLKASQKADTNKLIRDYCTEHGIVAPSRYLSDEACIEYLFSVSFTILQDLYRDIFKKQPDGLLAEDIANKILDKVLETEDLLHKSVDSVNKECKATGKQMVDKYEKDLLKFIYKEYKGRIHLSDETVTYNPPSVRNTVLKIISDYARFRVRYDILETRIKSIFDRCKANFTVDDYVLNSDPTASFMLDCISSWIGSPAPRNEWAKDEIENLRGQIDRLKDLINIMNEEVKDM